MLGKDIKDELRLIIQGTKIIVLKDFFQEIKTLLDAQGFSRKEYLEALLDVAFENGINENLLGALEREVEKLTSVKDKG